ncbi:MAG TPA: hypothetical protein QF461_04385, partial [Candidatus Thalassarchaeum sp.]|nr:hypothetical protein [Candidatus Thalassarchaeum sp.]
MAKSAEMTWLDAIEAEQSGDRAGALEAAKKTVAIDSIHVDGWMGVARWSLPAETRGKQVQPDLKQSAKSMTALRRVVQIDPENFEAWRLGGVLLVDHLGMLEDGLRWWQDRREIAPYEVAPLIEQIAILVRIGHYEECAELLEDLFGEGMEATSSNQLARMESVNRMVSRAAKMEEDEIFRPQNPKHPRWAIIERMKKRKPISPTFFLITFIAPIVFLLGTISMTLVGNSTWGFLMVFVFILICFMAISRVTSGLLHKLNRHALDLDRAIDIETSSGRICIPETIRYSKLYAAMVGQRMPALGERLELVVQSGDNLPIRWRPDIPEFSVIEEDRFDGT